MCNIFTMSCIHTEFTDMHYAHTLFEWNMIDWSIYLLILWFFCLSIYVQAVCSCCTCVKESNTSCTTAATVTDGCSKWFELCCGFSLVCGCVCSGKRPSVLWCCWLGGRKGNRPVENWVVGCWHGYLSGSRCRFSYGPADATATHCLLLQ